MTELQTEEVHRDLVQDFGRVLFSDNKKRVSLFPTSAWSDDGRLAFAIHGAAQAPELGVCEITGMTCRRFPLTNVRDEQEAGHVLIEYEAKDPSGKTAYKDTMALERIGGNWFLTQALAADPVLLHWNDPTGRVQVAPNSLFDKAQ